MSKKIARGYYGFHTERHGTTDTFDSPDKPFLQLLLNLCGLTVGILLVALGQDLGTLWPRKEVDQVHDTLLVDVAGLQDA